MKTLEELTKELQEKFNSNDVIGVIAVIDENTNTSCEDVELYDTLDQAKSNAYDLWNHLTSKEKEYHNITVCYISAKKTNDKIVPFYEDENGNMDSTIYEEFQWEI